MTTLRTPTTEELYQRVLTNDEGRDLAEIPPLRSWELWRLAANDFPYDQFFKVHHLLLPNREVALREDLTRAELQQFGLVLSGLEREYDCVLENFASKRTVRSRFHVHLLVYKD